jgi:hypothetical protein
VRILRISLFLFAVPDRHAFRLVDGLESLHELRAGPIRQLAGADDLHALRGAISSFVLPLSSPWLSCCLCAYQSTRAMALCAVLVVLCRRASSPRNSARPPATAAKSVLFPWLRLRLCSRASLGDFVGWHGRNDQRTDRMQGLQSREFSATSAGALCSGLRCCHRASLRCRRPTSAVRSTAIAALTAPTRTSSSQST